MDIKMEIKMLASKESSLIEEKIKEQESFGKMSEREKNEINKNSSPL